MRTSIDTNVLSGLLSREPETDNIVALLDGCRREGVALISPVVYAELLAYPGANEPFLRHFLRMTNISVVYNLEPSV